MPSIAWNAPCKQPGRLVPVAVVPLGIMLPALGPPAQAHGSAARLESPRVTVEIDTRTGRWSLADRRSGVRWPTRGTAAAGVTASLEGELTPGLESPRLLRLRAPSGAAVAFELRAAGESPEPVDSLEIRYENAGPGDVRALGDLLVVSASEGGQLIVPCREGLLLAARSGKTFRRTFGTSEYEGSHMNMLGVLKSGAALVVSWDDAYVFPEVEGRPGRDGAEPHELAAAFTLRRSARALRLTPLGQGDWNAIAAGYRRLAADKGLAVTLEAKIRRNPRAESLIGAANVKLWTCLARRMNEESTREESVEVHWTFAEAAAIAEHLRRDLEIERCLFILGGWTEGGYDCRHPDNLPANRECGGNAGLTAAVERIQRLRYVACLHDNVQDMYRDAKSWDPSLIEKRADGSLVTGGRWLGGRAYMVCAPKQLDLARRPQNLPGIHELFPVWSYFIDTTYAVGPRECHDPQHSIGRNEDIAWKCRLSDYAREVFGLFGSECGREWALPHSDFFEGLTGVSGRYYHNLDPETLGATVIPFWEMVYHDCQVSYGKYGYEPTVAAEYVAHHVLCARPLHYHSIPSHLYWQAAPPEEERLEARPRVVRIEPLGDRSFRIYYAWEVTEDAGRDWRVFVHFTRNDRILFQDDHTPEPPVSRWRRGTDVRVGPRVVQIPPGAGDEVLEIHIGLFDPAAAGTRAVLPGADAQRRVLAGRLRPGPVPRFEEASGRGADPALYTRSDLGWAAGMHPVDIFLKNTHEVLGPLHGATAHERLERFEFLTPDGGLRRATYGAGEAATSVVVNFSAGEVRTQSRLGGDVVLPPWGFVAEGPRFAAFCVRRWGGREYERAALFTLAALDGRRLEESRRVRVFHGFGDPGLRWRGRDLTVGREQVLADPGAE